MTTAQNDSARPPSAIEVATTLFTKALVALFALQDEDAITVLIAAVKAAVIDRHGEAKASERFAKVSGAFFRRLDPETIHALLEGGHITAAPEADRKVIVAVLAEITTTRDTLPALASRLEGVSGFAPPTPPPWEPD